MAKGFHDERYRWLIAQLVAARKAAKLSQAAVALRLGWIQERVSRYEIGERRLDAVELVDVANALGLNAATLLASIKPKPTGGPDAPSP